MTAEPTNLRELLRRKGVPFECDIELTHDCNQRCVHCFLECPRPDSYADPEMIRQALAELASLGCLRVGFTGGEPLLHPEFWSLLSEARRLGYAVDLSTNGTLLDQDMVDRLARMRMKSVRVSLLGACAETHDRIVGKSGAFALALAATQALARSGIRTQVGCVLLRNNYREAGRIRDLAASLGASAVFDPLPGPSICGHFDPRTGAVTLAQLERYVFPAIPKEQSDGHGCMAGVSQLAISPYGEVMPCVMLRDLVGKTGESRLGLLWWDSPVFAALRSRSSRNSRDGGSRGRRSKRGDRYCAGKTWLWRNAACSAGSKICRRACAQQAAVSWQTRP
jgi:MoaA/NifB/PqqE/SkfB family radical SAM enzyme